MRQSAVVVPICVGFFLFASHAATQAATSCCLYFAGKVHPGCYEVNNPDLSYVGGKVDSNDVFACSEAVSQQPDELAFGDILNANLAGSYETDAAACVSVAGYQAVRVPLAGETSPPELGFKIEGNAWCMAAKDIMGNTQLFPNFPQNLAAAQAAPPPSASVQWKPDPISLHDQIVSNQYGCCLYREGSEWSEECVKIQDFLVNGDAAQKFSCASYPGDALWNQIMPANFVGSAIKKQANLGCPTFAQTGYQYVDVKDVAKKSDSGGHTIDTVNISGYAFPESHLCMAGLDVAEKTKLAGLVEGFIDEAIGKIEGIAAEIQAYVATKKGSFCCIPQKKTIDSACYQPYDNDTILKEAQSLFATTQVNNPGVTVQQIMDSIWEQSQEKWAALFLRCTPTGSVVIPEGKGFYTIEESYKDLVTETHWLVSPGCQDTAIPPVVKAKDPTTGQTIDWEPCDAGDTACAQAFAQAYPGGVESVTLAKWCALPRKFCACKKNRFDCIDHVYDAKVTTAGSATTHPECQQDAASRGTDWECFEADPAKLDDLTQTAADGTGGVDSCLVYKVSNEFACADGTKVSLESPAEHEPTLIKQVCSLCRASNPANASIQIGSGSKSCAISTTLPAIKPIPNPVAATVGSPQDFVAVLIRSLLGIIGALALGLVVYGGVVWMTSAGNQQRVDAGRATVMWAAVGLVAVFVASVVVRFIFSSLG